MQETWWKWSRWKNYIKYEADILINQTKMSIEWKEKAKGYANQKDNEIWKIQSPYSWATIIRTIPLRFRFPNCLPPQKDDIWGSGGGESPTKLKLEYCQALNSIPDELGWFVTTFRLKYWQADDIRFEQANEWKMHTKNIRKHGNGINQGLTSRPRTTIKSVSWVYLAIKQSHSKNNIHEQNLI